MLPWGPDPCSAHSGNTPPGVTTARLAAAARDGPHRRREVGGGRSTRQPGQVRKEAALTRPGGSLSSLPLLLLYPRRRSATRVRHAPRALAGSTHAQAFCRLSRRPRQTLQHRTARRRLRHRRDDRGDLRAMPRPVVRRPERACISIPTWRSTSSTGTAVSLAENAPAGGKALYFINLGGYAEGAFTELHANMIVVAPSAERGQGARQARADAGRRERNPHRRPLRRGRLPGGGRASARGTSCWSRPIRQRRRRCRSERLPHHPAADVIDAYVARRIRTGRRPRTSLLPVKRGRVDHAKRRMEGAAAASIIELSLPTPIDEDICDGSPLHPPFGGPPPPQARRRQVASMAAAIATRMLRRLANLL